jgi:hypothetical protein
MAMELDKLLLECVQQGIRDGIKSKLSQSYNNPLDKLIDQCLTQHDAKFRELVNAALTTTFEDTTFRKQVIDGVSHKLGTLLVARFGGELEKQVNVLKSDPSTRARITLAIENIVKSREPAPV